MEEKTVRCQYSQSMTFLWGKKMCGIRSDAAFDVPAIDSKAIARTI